MKVIVVGLTVAVGMSTSGCDLLFPADNSGTQSVRSKRQVQDSQALHQQPEKLDWLEQGTGNTVPDPNPPIMPSTSTSPITEIPPTV